MSEQDVDRSQAATPFKLEEARKKGMVAKSPDMVGAVMLSVFTLFLFASGWQLARDEIALSRYLFLSAGTIELTFVSSIELLTKLLVAGAMLLLPFAALLIVAAVVANIIQTGPVFSSQPLVPDFQRLNIVEGLKRFFSVRSFYDAGRGFVKVLVMVGILFFAIKAMLPLLISLPNVPAVAHAAVMLDRTASLLFKLVIGLIVLAIVDLMYTQWEFGKQMRMTHRDIRDEHKQREGDPRIRAKLRELRVQMLKRSKSMRSLPTSDVLITNPTHLAVAISYRHGEMTAPRVVSKGLGYQVKYMRSIAAKNGITIIQNPPLARALYEEVDYDGFVPEKHYSEVAKIMVWIHAMRSARNSPAQTEAS